MKKIRIIEEDVIVEIEWLNGEFPVKSVSISMNIGGNQETLSEDKSVKNLLKDIRSYLKGKRDGLPIGLLDLRHLSPFSKKVICELRKSVHSGETVSYAELANLAGHPGAARAVGTVLRNNPFPIFFPCHRVIRSNGDIGLFQGSREGAVLKKKLLDLESGIVSSKSEIPV